MNQTYYCVDEIPFYKIHGRSRLLSDSIALFWTGSAIELNVSGSSLFLHLESLTSTYENWISILCNDVCISRFMLSEGEGQYCLFRNMNPDTVKNIKVIKDVQAMSQDEQHCLKIKGISTDGVFHEVQDKPYKIEFIGDSITSGEGAIGGTTEEDWLSMWFSALNNYTYLTAKDFGAEYRIISQSGWGVLSDWQGNREGAIPPIYEKICGVLKEPFATEIGAQNLNDFSHWQPDFVVINLGTNDSNAMLNTSTNKYDLEELLAFKKGVVNFLKKCRTYNPTAYIVWAYGILGYPLEETIKEALFAYQEESGDSRTAYVSLPEMTTKGLGARFHPGLIAHEAAAEVLVQALKALL